ncbi:hypothetical protein [Rheinheimera texasensis]|uniref:hypothetical protein n=1 Tax=Rheinheimera texasensis TaxID=306205 RepID=UPI0032B3071E
MSNGSDKNEYPSKYFFKKSSQVNLAIHTVIESCISNMELMGRFLYPYSIMPHTPLQHVVEKIKHSNKLPIHPSNFWVGIHSYAYIKSFQFAGLSAISGLTYYGIDIRKNGLTRENSLMMTGNSFYAIEVFLRIQAMGAFNLHRFETISRRGSAFGAVGDSIKMINYIAERDYPTALMYGLLSAGNLGMMMHSIEHPTGVGRNFAGIFKTISPTIFFRSAIPLCFYSIYKIFYSNDKH